MVVSIPKVSHLLYEGKAVDVIFLDFSEAFYTTPHITILDKLSTCVINRFMLCWVMNRLKGRAQRVVVKGAVASLEGRESLQRDLRRSEH